MKTIRFIKLEETYIIRKEVLRKNIDLTYKFDGDYDENTFHLGVFVDNELVCIASFMKEKNKFLKGKQYQLRGMATLTSHRGKGYGKMILK